MAAALPAYPSSLPTAQDKALGAQLLVQVALCDLDNQLTLDK